MKASHRSTGEDSVSTVEIFLVDLDYPVHKSELVVIVEDNNAPPELLELLDGLEDRNYTDLDDVMQGLGQVT